MRSWDEAYDALKEFDHMAGESDDRVEAYLDGQAVVMYYGDQAGADETYRETDDVDLLLRDAEYLSVAEEYGFVFRGSGNIPLGNDMEIDMLVDEDAVGLLDRKRSEQGGRHVEGLDNLTLYVPPPDLFARKKREVGRDKDVEDADRLERIAALL